MQKSNNKPTISVPMGISKHSVSISPSNEPSKFNCVLEENNIPSEVISELKSASSYLEDMDSLFERKIIDLFSSAALYSEPEHVNFYYSMFSKLDYSRYYEKKYSMRTLNLDRSSTMDQDEIGVQ